MGTIHGGPCSGSARPKTLLSGSARPSPRVSSSASPARIPNWEREEGKATSRAPGLVPSPRRLRRPSSPARIPNWEREEGKATSRAPGLVPSPRHLRRPSSPARIPNWEREEGKATSRAPSLVPSPRRLRRPSSPARNPNWEREEGKATSQRPASCRRSVVSGDRRLLLASLTGSERRGKLHPERPASCRRSDPMMLLSQPAPDGEDSSIRLASSSTTHSMTRPVLHGRKRCQCNPRCVVVSVVEYVLCAMPTTACLICYMPILKFHRALHRASHPPCVSRVTSLITTVSAGLVTTKY